VIAELTALADDLPDGADKARAEAAVAQVLMLMQDQAAVDWADRAIAHGTAAGDERVVVQARVERASAHAPGVTREEAMADLREASEGARALGDGVLLSRALNNSLELIPPHGEESARLRELLRSTATALGFDKLGHRNVLWWDASAAHADGDLAAYRRLLEEWASWAAAPKPQTNTAIALADLASEEGRVTDAIALLDQVVEQRDAASSKDATAGPRLVLAALERRNDLGRDAVERLLASPPPADEWETLGIIVELVSAALAVEIPPQEIRQRVLGEYLAGQAASCDAGAWVEGPLALAEGRPADAVKAFAATLPAASECLRRPTEASLRLAHAQALLAAGDRAGALAECRRAHELLARWPGWRRDRVEAMLVRLEGSGARQPAGALTARESEVAMLIAEGLTNGQLAERLFISPKTAAVHVSNILAKLGLASRAEVAAWAVRRELPVAG
jgi:DNA-binding CsgD family transcriptional regulator